MPGEVRKVEASSLYTNGGQTKGMIRQNAIVDMSDNICASGMLHPQMQNTAISLIKVA